MRPDAAIAALRSLRNEFGRGAAAARKRALRLRAAAPPGRPAELRAYHDLLLFMAAHPDDPETARLVEPELRRVAAAAAVLAGKPRAGAALRNSGIAGTVVEASFSIDLLEWLLESGCEVEIAWENGSAGTALDEVLPLIAARVEGDGLLCDAISTQRWIELASGGGGGRSLAWLLGQLRRLPGAPEALDRLFEGLDLHVRWSLDEAHSATLCRFPSRPVAFQRGSLRRAVSLPDLLRRPLPPPRRLSDAQRLSLLGAARTALAVRQRETDPLTWANPQEIELFCLERGVDVALFGMCPQRRLPVESYFGYMVARNRVPAAYGGGWVFFDRAEIGTNVFDALRGGESAYLFGQVLRVYHHHYRVRRFLVDPYQVGRDNPEAIRSGAFWFYYRMGFRPLDHDAAALARSEWSRIRGTRSYRTPPAMLRRLARSRVALDCPGAPPRNEVADLVELGLAVTAQIGRRFGGDRRRAGRWAAARVARALRPLRSRRWPPQERAAFGRLALLVAMIPDLARWTRASKRALVGVMRAKGGVRERDHALRLQRHGPLREALAALAASQKPQWSG